MKKLFNIFKIKIRKRYGENVIEYPIEFIRELKNGYKVVKKNKKYNITDLDGKFLMEGWYDYIGDDFNEDGLIRIGFRLWNGNYSNLLSENGNFLFDCFKPLIVKINSNLYKVLLWEYGDYMYLDKNDTPLIDMKFKHGGDFKNGKTTYVFNRNEQYNILTIDGKLLFGEWRSVKKLTEEEIKNIYVLYDY